MENRKYNFVLSDETSKMIDDHLENSRHRFRSEFVSEAIRRYCCDLDTSKHRNVMTEEIERIMDAIEDRRLRIIVRDYYALGWSEERVGEHVGISRQHVNRLRTAYLDSL